ncbi:MAG TPA: hypothetical protein VGT98_06950, partial [Candidatus Elarobacter sp.]|nr:hypothetical protein [Candidatus Elarobacter sp.]
PMYWRRDRIGTRAIWLARGIPSTPFVSVELSPAARAAMDSARSTFANRAALLDSMVRVYRHGPAPTPVTLTDSAPVSNADRHGVIVGRMAAVHALLARASVSAIYRDARYRDCTFVRAATSPAVEVGYVFTPSGCALAGGRGDARLAVEPVRDTTWSVYVVR